MMSLESKAYDVFLLAGQIKRELATLEKQDNSAEVESGRKE